MYLYNSPSTPNEDIIEDIQHSSDLWMIKRWVNDTRMLHIQRNELIYYRKFPVTIELSSQN